MKKSIYCFLILIGVVSSCFQEPNLSKPESIYKADVLDFLERASTNLNDETLPKVDELKSSLDFKHVKTIKSHFGQEILVVPISSLQKIQGKYVQAVFYRNSNAKIDFGEIISIDPTIENFSSTEGLIEDAISNKSLTYTGKFSVFSVYQDLKFFNSYENGKITVNGKVRAAEAKAKGSGRENSCTDWYLVTTYYYSDGSTSQTSEFVGRSCDDCTENTTRGSAINCGGGPGGDGGGSLPNNPSVGTLAQVRLPNGVWKLLEWTCDDAHCYWKDIGTTVPAVVVSTNQPTYYFLTTSPYGGQMIYGPDGLLYIYNANTMEWSGEMLYISKDPIGARIAAIAEYLRCLSRNQGAQVTIYIDQPTPGSRNAWSGSALDPDVGHTFVSIQQNGITRVFGYYPEVAVRPDTPTAPGVLFDDSGHEYDVRLDIWVDAAHLGAVIDAATSAPATYNLNTFNCTDFGIAISQAAGVPLADTQGTWIGGGGSNPGDLGQDVRAMASSGNVVVNGAGGYGPTRTGECQ
jgi:hypothetical protein